MKDKSPFDLHTMAVVLSLDDLLKYDVAHLAQAEMDSREYLYVESLTVEEIVRAMAYGQFRESLSAEENEPPLRDLRMDVSTGSNALIVNIAWITLKEEEDG